MNTFDEISGKIDWHKSADGLLPAIVQQAGTGTVLMLAWMNRQALQTTMQSGRVTFFSRSRQKLWTKGETSGHFLQLVSVNIDCDGDTLLLQARPTGPVCHTGQATCFGDVSVGEFAFLARLQRIIDQRVTADPQSSYTAQLLHGPFHRVAQKVGEEAVETILAATCQDDDSTIEEAADLLYHLMVMLAARGQRLETVVQCLERRHAEGGGTSSKP
jgi:phosphoribosyl-ATP pyrophosphohydrolase/phosphoribosyl-AMP cyclohydrolase